MIETLTKNWRLLVLCAVFDAMISVIYFDHAGRGFSSLRDIMFLGKVALAAGACAIVASLRRSAKGKCWLLVLNGLALGVLGLIFNGMPGSRISFRVIALVITLMAMSLGILELTTARILRHQRCVADGWVFDVAGAVSIGFAFAFLAPVFHWIKPQPGSFSNLLWLGSYFGFSAICMLWLALRLHFQIGRGEALTLLRNPRHAF